MKRMVIVLMLLIVSAALFANGTRENAPAERGEGVRFDDSEAVSLSGILDVSGEEVVLSAEEGDFTLSAPRARLLDLEDYDTLEVSVSGMLVSCDDCELDYDGHIFVSNAAVDGEAYDFSNPGNTRQYSDINKGGYQQERSQANGDSRMQNQRSGNKTDNQDFARQRGQTETNSRRMDSRRGYSGGGIL